MWVCVPFSLVVSVARSLHRLLAIACLLLLIYGQNRIDAIKHMNVCCFQNRVLLLCLSPHVMATEKYKRVNFAFRLPSLSRSSSTQWRRTQSRSHFLPFRLRKHCTCRKHLQLIHIRAATWIFCRFEYIGNFRASHLTLTSILTIWYLFVLWNNFDYDSK